MTASEATHATKPAAETEYQPIFIDASSDCSKARSKRSKQKEVAQMRIFSGECEIIDILREEARSPQVLGELEELRKKGSQVERERGLIKLRHRILARVNNWFLDLKPRPRLRQKWWPYTSKDILK